ncbi:MAG: DNA polymerase/3'-5' exonuclease PolX [Patescibacteria group bacterium]
MGIHRFSNHEIAELLFEIGQLLELTGENRFKVIAYENAARTIQTYPHDLATMYEATGTQGLDAIQGVGEKIAQKMSILFDTGKLPFYEKLQKTVPPLQLVLLGITGIGPQTAKKLTDTFRPKNLSDLKRKLQTKDAREYFGEKTIENILAALKERRHEERHLVNEVEPIAESVLAFLRELSEVSAADPVGSLRRRNETIGDIDLVAATTDAKATVAALRKAPFTRRTVVGGTGLTTILHESGFQIDIEFVPPSEYGSLLQHFTGGKEHNVALRTWADDRGLSLSEKGIRTVRTGKLKTYKTEQAFYKALKMDWIPPELRENQGELEAARAGKLPRLIEESDIRGNLHVHTASSDGELSLNDMVKAAHDYGYAYIAITDHSRGAGGGLLESDLAKHRDAIRALDRKYVKKGMRVFAGVEVNIRRDGAVDVSDALLKTLDFVIGSVHSSFRQSIDEMTRRILKAIQNPNVDCIGHPSGRKLLHRDEISVNWDEVYRAASDTKTLLEINATPDRLDLSDTKVRAAKEAGVRFVINTDAHHPAHFQFMRYGVGVARRGWLEKEDVLNTRTADQCSDWLHDRR